MYQHSLDRFLGEVAENLLNSAQDIVHVDNVLMDREFDSQHVLDAISERGLTYVVPKRMQTSEKRKRNGSASGIRIGM